MQKQLGLDMLFTDPVTQEFVPWGKAEAALLARIREAPWKLVDVETTGLNPASKEQKFSGKQYQRGVDSELRLRVVTVLYPTPSGMPVAHKTMVESFDLDPLDEEDRVAVCSACFTNVVMAHNAGFDAYWLRTYADTTPDMLLDSMLISRILYPEQPIVMARMCSYTPSDADYENLSDAEIQHKVALAEEARAMFMAGASGWSLAHLAVGKLGRILPKEMQGPKNWCEPFLSQKAYNYATDDVKVMLDLVMALFEIDDPTDLLVRYLELAMDHSGLGIVEPQVWDIVQMRETGMPWSREEAELYVAAQWAKVGELAKKMVEIEPALQEHYAALSDPSTGINEKLKTAIGQAFTDRGIELQVTEKTGAFKIGEKDLRRVKAANSDDAKELFNVWTSLNRAKKAGGMAKEVSNYAARSHDGRLHPNTGHGPVTGRLSSSEPNCQQFPRDQGFRNCVRARANHAIVSADYSALDMRVGAALAIRAQRQLVEAYQGSRKCESDVLRIISRVIEKRITLEEAQAMEAKANAYLADRKERREQILEDVGKLPSNRQKQAKQAYWDSYRKAQRDQLLMSFQRCYAYVRMRAEEAGTPEWGSLRDAFSIEGMDIHTWTALDMTGQSPKALFEGLEGEAVAKELKKWKGVLGDKRQTGKVGNLSLLYAMQARGLMEAAAKNYNIHWTLEEAADVREKWLAAFVEIDLWHKWTELNPVETVAIPDRDRGGQIARKQIYGSYTLGDRLIYAFGLNAALSYEDQSTGADILGRVMQGFRAYPEVFATIINQVHDEVLFEVPKAVLDEYNEIIGRVMTEAAEYFLEPYGVKAGCEPEAGDVWLKG